MMLPHLLSRLRQRLVTSQRRRPARAPARLGLERLEDRLAPAVIAVVSTADNTNPVITAGHAGTAADPFLAPSLRSAISFVNNATDGANNVIDLAVAGTYKITLAGTPGETDNAAGEFAILPSGTNGNSLTVQNTSGGTATVDANHLNRVFDINPNNLITAPKFAVTMSGFTITGGDASDPANSDAPSSSGGGIRDQNNVSLTLTDMVLTNNVASADGGGVSMENASASTPWALTLNNTIVRDNHAGDAGGGVETDGTGQVFITGGQLTGNTALNQGAAVWLDAIGTGSANLTLTNVLVNGNAAQNGPTGAIGNAGNGAVAINGSTIENNSSGTTGGGFGDEHNLGTLSVSNSLFLNNSAVSNGGGIQEGGSQTTITNTSLRGNSSGGSGGGLFANGTTLTITGSTIVNNTAGTAGGGLEVQTAGTATITNTTITGNSALNNTGANGGGIDAPAAFTGTLMLLNDTINGNFATNGGGIFWGGTAGTFALQNTIVAGNSAATGPDADSPGTFTDDGGNLIGISGAGSGNSGFTAGTTQTGTTAIPLDPKLGPLQNNGGPTVGVTGLTLETEALLTGSPALGKGVATGAPATDERGFARPDGPAGENPDVGAFEFQDASLSIMVLPSFQTVALGSTATFAVVVTDTSGNALPDDNSTVTVALSDGLAPDGATTFTLGALAAGQGRTFIVSAATTALGTQNVTATVVSPDTTLPSASASATINLTPPPATPAPPAAPASFNFTQAFIQLEVEAYFLALDFVAAFNEGGFPDPVLAGQINQLLTAFFTNPLFGTASGLYAETLGYDFALPILMSV